MRTSQNSFTALKGHVSDGCEVIANNGDLLTIKATMHGWDIYRNGVEISRAGHNAYNVEVFIANYQGA